MARSPRFPPTASNRQQKRTPPPAPSARPAPSQCTRRSTQPPEPPCIPQKRKSLPATPPLASPSAAGARLKIHSARDSPPGAAVPRNKKTPPQSKSVKPQPSARSVRSGSESDMDKEDRKQLPPADRIHGRQSANTKGCRNAPKFQATHNANCRAPANSR